MVFNVWNKNKKAFYLLLLTLILCVPINIKGAHISRNGTVYSTNGFTCDINRPTIGGSPCVIQVYLDDFLATNGSRTTRLKHTQINGKNKVVFCVEHGKQNPENGSYCLLKYQNYYPYVLAGLGEIIKKSGGTNLTVGNVKNNFQSGYVTVAIAQNNLLQTLGFYQDSDNDYFGGHQETNNLANKGLYASFYYYNYATSKPFDVDLSFNNSKLVGKIVKKNLELKRNNKKIISGQTQYDECKYFIKDGNSGSCSDLEKGVESAGKKEITLTFKKKFYLASLYDCVGQDVTLANVAEVTLTTSVTKKIPGTVKVTITKKDQSENLLPEVKFTISSKSPDGRIYDSTAKTKATNASGQAVFYVEPNKKYYLFEGFYYDGSACKYDDDNDQKVFFNANPLLYKLNETEYENKSGLEITQKVRGFYSQKTCGAGYFTKNGGTYSIDLPVYSFSVGGNDVNISVKNNKISDCNPGATPAEIESKYQGNYGQNEPQYRKYRKILNFNNPKCEEMKAPKMRTTIDCLSAKVSDGDSLNETETEFKNFNQNDLSSYEEIISPSGTTLRAYCKSSYEVFPSEKTKDLEPVIGGQLYFNVPNGKIMVGKLTRVCYVIGNQKSTIEGTGVTWINRTPETTGYLKKDELNIINFTSRTVESDLDVSVVKNSKNFDFTKIVYKADVIYNLPEVFSTQKGKIINNCDGNDCISLGYGIVSPISTNKKNVSNNDLSLDFVGQEQEVSQIADITNDEGGKKIDGTISLSDSNEFETITESDDYESLINTNDLGSQNLETGRTGSAYSFSEPEIIDESSVETETYEFGLGFTDAKATCNYSYEPKFKCNNKECLEFRIIDTETPFTNKNGIRETMSNWCYGNNCSYNNALVNKYINYAPNSYGIKKNKEGQKEKVAPKYKIVLTPQLIKDISNCDGQGDCISNLINSNLVKNN